MPEMSEKYLEVLLQVSGKNLIAEKVNPLICQYDKKLKNLKVEEQRSDGKVFKAAVCNVDNRQHELLDKNNLICSRQIKWNIFDPYPHNANNSEHFIHVRLHKRLMEITVKIETSEGEIIVQTTDTHVFGNSRNKRWPRDRFAGAGF